MQDADLVRLAAATYNPSSVDWDVWYDGSSASGGICAGIKDNVLACRGSYCREDWLRDFEVIKLGTSKIHPEFGLVHAGFDEGMDEFFAQASQHLGEGATFTGHSLGASHAWLAAGRYIIAGGRPAGITVFGSPKPGGQQFAEFLSPYPKSSYRNGDDPVTEVPFVIGTEVALAPIIPKRFKVEPTDWTEGLMAWHSIALYQQGVCAPS